MTESLEKTFLVSLTEKEMQQIVNTCGAFYRKAEQQNTKLDPFRTALLINVFQKFQASMNETKTDKDVTQHVEDPTSA